MVSIKEIKSTIAVAIAAAFGFIIALIWKDIIVGLMNMAGLKVNDFSQASNPTMAAIIAVISAVVITVVSVLGIVYISKWGGVGQK